MKHTPATNRHRFIALLITLLIGHVALTVHLATHTLADQQECDICIGHANPSHAIIPSVLPIPAPVETEISDIEVSVAVSIVRRFHFRQRGPPNIV